MHPLRLLVAFAALAALTARAAGAPPVAGSPRGPAIEFCGEELSLAYVEVMPDGSVLNEYLRPDEDIGNWHILVALRHHPDAVVDEIVLRWRNHVTQLPSSDLVLKEYQKNTRTDQRFTLALHDPTDTTMELDAMRFVPDDAGDGVNYYQAAVRVLNEKSPRAIEEALERQKEFAEALPALKLAPVLTQPGAAPASSPAPGDH